MTLRAKPAHFLVPAAFLLAVALACGEDDVATPVPPGGPDTRAPETITDLELGYDSLTSSLTFTWTARRDDLVNDRADHFDLRYGAGFPFDWDTSTRITDPPLPLDAGEVQSYGFAEPRRGRDVYAAIRAVDSAGNESLVSNVAHVRVPGYSFTALCTDVLSGSPIEGLDAVVTSRRVDHVLSGADGRIRLTELSSGTLGVLLTTGSASTGYHTFDDAFNLNDDVSIMYSMIPFQQTASPLYSSVLELLKFAIFSPGTDKVVKRWKSYPVPWYAPSFVNVNGLDYRDLAAQAAQRWNTRLGFEMFEPVSSDPTTGILMEFLPRGVMGTVVGITEYTLDAEGYPRHDRIRIVDDFNDGERLYAVFMHELGHTIPLGHLGAGFIMFASQPLPTDISDDEVLMVQLMLAMPNGTNLTNYDANPPAP